MRLVPMCLALLMLALPAHAAPLPSPLRVPPGYRAEVFAAGLPGVRMLAWSPRGELTASRPAAGEIVLLPDADHDGQADKRMIFARGLDRPHGLAWHQGQLYVACSGSLERLRPDPAQRRAIATTRLSSDLPAGGMHWTRTLAFDRQGQLLVSVGSSCNVCEEADPRRAAILRLGPAGRMRPFARGLRNAVGLRLHPDTGELWATENGRDHLGHELPPDEVNRIVAGGDYGWPYAYGARVPDPAFGDPERAERTLGATVELPAHGAPLGLEFLRGPMVPEAYRGDLVVASHGSWNRWPPRGYQVLRIHFPAGRAPQVSEFVGGWLVGTRAWGRPVDVLMAPDGALMISDDMGGRIYRVSRVPAGR